MFHTLFSISFEVESEFDIENKNSPLDSETVKRRAKSEVAEFYKQNVSEKKADWSERTKEQQAV